MWFRTILYILALIALLIIQITFLAGFDFWLFNINLLIIGLVILINVTEPKNILIYSVICGLVMDVYSILPFGIYLLIFFLTAIILEVFFMNLFTNRSFYSLLILGLISIVTYHLIFVLASGFLYLINASDFSIRFDYFGIFVWQLMSTLILLFIFYYLINKVSRLFKPTF